MLCLIELTRLFSLKDINHTDMNKFPPFSVYELSSHKVGLISLANLV